MWDFYNCDVCEKYEELRILQPWPFSLTWCEFVYNLPVNKSQKNGAIRRTHKCRQIV